MSDLRARAAGQEVARVTPEQRSANIKTVNDMMKAQLSEIQRALPKHLTADRLARLATTVLRQTPELGECTPLSFIGALMTCAQLGLEPGPLGEAYFTPHRNKKTGQKEVTFVAGYQGLLKLAWNSGGLASFNCHEVRERDVFDYEYGSKPYLRHKPALGDRGSVIGYYAAAEFKGGGGVFEFMSQVDVNAHRDKFSQQPNGFGWRDNAIAMGKKTVVRQLSKWLPKSTEMQRALDFDGTVRTDFGHAIEEAEPWRPAPVDADIDTRELPPGLNTDTGEIVEPDDEAIDPATDREIPADWPTPRPVGVTP